MHLVDDSTQASRLRQQVRTTAADIGIGQNSMQENGDFSTESGKMEKVVKCKPQGVHDQTLDELGFCHTVAGNDVLRADTRGHCSAKKKKPRSNGRITLHCLVLRAPGTSYYWFSIAQMVRYFELGSPLQNR